MQEMLEETLGSCAVSTVLHQNVQHNAVLIHRKCLLAAAVFGVASWRSRNRTSVPDALMGHHDAAFGQDQLDVTQAYGKLKT
jgi:hypothetical protein